jgi:tryptophan synthase alpha chain
VRVGAALSAARAAGRPALVPYLMVDRGRGSRLRSLVGALAEGGATALELGIPFSDPIADGPVLQAAADRSLSHGTRFADVLAQARTASRQLPTAVMTYANPIWRHGLDRALSALSAAGATALIVPDLSYEERGPWARAARRAGLDLVLLAAPGISAERVRRIAVASRGFLYLVSRYGTTGRGSRSASPDLSRLVDAAHRAAPSLPVLLGFGVRDRPSARAALGTGADGVIVGSAVEERVAGGGSPAALGHWLRSLGMGTGHAPPDGQP